MRASKFMALIRPIRRETFSLRALSDHHIKITSVNLKRLNSKSNLEKTYDSLDWTHSNLNPMVKITSVNQVRQTEPTIID